ncbi:MAG: glucose 1-dehydrogenase [Solirubrobacterales bacterium]|nr:glucose 1-dehydrogenase [Solirubrobacterales bacterium]
MDRLLGKTAVITGAGSGIGRASALKFASEGAAVAVTDIVAESALAVAEEVRSAGGTAVGFRVDVADDEALKELVDRPVREFGRLDIRFNNALTTAAGKKKRDVDFLEFDPAVFQEIVQVNVLGGVVAAKYALPHMLERGNGCILFTSSTSSLGGDVAQFSYGASKAMVNWYVQTIATVYGKRGIRCNAVVPGVIETPAMKAWASPEMNAAFMALQNVPRLGRPEDIANLACILASDEAEFMNGALYKCDGGMTAPLPFAQLQRDFLLPRHAGASTTS